MQRLTRKLPKPPGDLTSDAKSLWERIFDEVELDEPALLLLNILCEQWDRLMQARELIRKEGITVADRFGQSKPHPACSIERDSLTAMMRAWRLLGFDQVPPGPIGRPPGT